MKVLPWFALLFACTAVPADAHLTFAGTPKIDLFSSARLIDTNQSQSLEAVSTADGNLRLPSYKLAGVYFITGNNGQTFDNEAKDNDFTDPTGDNCKRLGFAVTSCASGLFNRACPYNDRIYDKCCEASYTYEASNCPAPRKLSSETCGGKHRCYCDTAQYPFASCSDPQIKGNACTDDGGTRYATCVCPNPVSTPYGCETYYAAPCGSVCKKAYADNCRNRTAVQTPYARNILTTVPPNAKRLIPIIAEIEMRSPRLTAASRFTATASQNAKWLIRTTVITGSRQSPLVRQTRPALILPTVLPKSNPGAVTRAMRNPVTLA